MPQGLSLNPKFSSFKQLTIGVLCGGRSSERKISLKSGKAIYDALQRTGFHAILIDPVKKENLNRLLKTIDIAFLGLHGIGGEDGKIQLFLERKGISYTGSTPRGCRLSMDKALTKKILISRGIPTPPYTLIKQKNWQSKIEKMSLPLFFKPPKEGSSIGVFSVIRIQAAAHQISRSLKHYGQMMVEKKIIGREFTVGILGNQALPVIELKPKNDFYDFKSKYTKGMTQYIVPAKIPVSMARKMQRLALRTHRALGLRDLSRVDLMADQKGKLYILEANSIPGFTEFSLLPKAARCAGISFEDLCATIVGFAAKRSFRKRMSQAHGQKKTF